MQIENQVFRDTEQNILHLTKWNHKLNQLNWVLFGVLVFLEIVISIIFGLGVTLGSNISPDTYIIRYLLMPCGIVFISISASHIIGRKLMTRYSLTVQSRFGLFTLILIISEVVAIHHGISVIYALYALPIIISVVYVNKRTVLMMYIACIVFYLVTFFGYISVFVSPQDYYHNYMSIIGTIGMLTAVYALCLMLFARVRELINTAVSQSIRQMELSHEVTLDSLTHLYNHATFYEKLDEYIVRQQNEQINFAIIIMDIDNFKQINDAYGHDMGNVVLLKLVELIRQYIRDDDLAFRYGGEEFTIITPHSHHALQLAENIRVALASYEFPGILHKITISMGLCEYHESFGGRREFFSAADKALYQAKQSGKNCVRIAMPFELPPIDNTMAKDESCGATPL